MPGSLLRNGFVWQDPSQALLTLVIEWALISFNEQQFVTRAWFNRFGKRWGMGRDGNPYCAERCMLLLVPVQGKVLSWDTAPKV